VFKGSEDSIFASRKFFFFSSVFPAYLWRRAYPVDMIFLQQISVADFVLLELPSARGGVGLRGAVRGAAGCGVSAARLSRLFGLLDTIYAFQ